MSVLYLPGFLSVLLYFFSVFLSLSGFSYWMSESPGPLHHGQPGWGPGSWPWPVDLQHGGCGHWEGGCFAPTHPAAFSTLPCECLPSFPKTPICPWLTVYDPGFLLSHHKIILILPLPVCILPPYMGCFPDKCLPSLFTFSAPQLSKCCVAPPICLDPLLSESIGLNCGERRGPPRFVLQHVLPELTIASASLALGVPPSASALRRGRGICPGTEAGASRGHEAAPLLHPACCPQERSVGMLVSCSECLP